MASFEEYKNVQDSDFILVQRKNPKNMRRGKPVQQIYRPGSGLLRKSNTLDESGSDTNIVINSRQNQPKHTLPTNDVRFKSEGSSPRDKTTDIDSTTSRLGDISLDRDSTKRPKRPEKEIYVPRPIAQTREVNTSQDLTHTNTFQQTNGNENDFVSSDRSRNNTSHSYTDRKRGNNNEYQERVESGEWREQPPSGNRPRQGSEPRGLNNGAAQNWDRTRDTRSVEPSGISNRNYRSDKLQSKPPSGRRHSIIGPESDKRSKPIKQINFDLLPPRLQKKYLADNNIQLPDGNWDGTSLTFQGHTNYNNPKNPSYHQMTPNYNTLPNTQNFYDQNVAHSGYHTLPNKQRGRGRFYHDQQNPGLVYSHNTPDRGNSPGNSRPSTPPFSGSRRADITPYTTPNKGNDYQNSWGHGSQARYNNTIKEEAPKEMEPRNQLSEVHDSRENNNRGRDYNSRGHNDYNRSGKGYNREDDRDADTPSRNQRKPRDNHGRRDRDNYRNNKRGGGNFNRDRKRENRRDRERRSNSGDNNGVPQVGIRKFEDEEGVRSNDVQGSKGNAGFRKSLEAQLSPVSPEEKSVPVFPQMVSKTMDWSEEVELNYKLEADHFSDALTRSSSITSLQDLNIESQTAAMNVTPVARRMKRNGTRDSSASHASNNASRQNSATSIDSRDSFKAPLDPYFPNRQRSKERRENSYDRYHNSSRNHSRDCSWDRHHNTNTTSDNWREEMVQSRKNSERESASNFEEIKNVDVNTKKAGVIVLPQQKTEAVRSSTVNTQDHPRFPETGRTSGHQKSLFDPNNPSKPIVVKSCSTRVTVPGFSDNNESDPPQMITTDQFGNIRPPWYDENNEQFKSCHYPVLLRDIRRADTELQYNINSGLLLVNWHIVDRNRQFLKEALEYLLCKTMRFCQSENVEQHFWKIIYHNIIEVTRKAIKQDPENKDKYKGFLLYLLDEGSKYFEGLLNRLEETYNFKLNNFLGENNMVSHKGLGPVGLALVSAQKLFLFLGDLGRYREEVNETSNYGKCRQWYIKAHEINPKNGKPYNQLALLAVYARRKLDAVYYYMRSLMSSNPVPSARESLISLFDENRKKYEQGEKKRREERLERHRQHMKQKESEESRNAPGSLRKETWIHPDGKRRVHRTTQASLESDEEDLTALSSVEVNKRFVISYLHVHGKLITNIGMESFQETAMQMLKEFRALLQHSPVPLPCNRFLQLLALNMFAIESTQLKDPQLQSQPGYRSELQERALVVSLQMFNLILERCVSILQEHLLTRNDTDDTVFLPQDANVLLPAVKVWCDWMLGHTKIWNPPPSTHDFRVGSPGDAWSRLATLMNQLEQINKNAFTDFVKEKQEGYDPIRLPEDSILSGFTPLLYTAQDTFAPSDLDAELAHFSLRISKLLFFGTVYLCGVDPPVLKLEIENNVSEYVSVICTSNSRDSPPTPRELIHNNDILLESFSDDEGEKEEETISSNASSEIMDLLTRKVELEKRKRSQDLHMQRVKKILSQSVVSVHMEVRPKKLVPDTNCFIDHMEGIRTIARSNFYTLMVPIVVLSELEGLSLGGKGPTPDSRSSLDPQHVEKVASAAKNALEFLKTRHSSVKCVTTQGTILPSTTFSTEDDTLWDNNFRNDDKILATCLVLCKGHKEHIQEATEGEPRHLLREVVLLTEDRNLRVKAHARDVPVRELPDFMQWAGLG